MDKCRPLIYYLLSSELRFNNTFAMHAFKEALFQANGTKYRQAPEWTAHIVTLLFSGQNISIFKISQFSILLSGDRVVIPGSNDRSEDGKIDAPFLNYTVKGLLFKITVIPAVFSRCTGS